MGSEERKYFFLKADATGEEYIASSDETLIVPLDAEGAVLFARETAPAFGRAHVLILPGGTVEPHETLAETANRELQEELGVRAARMEYLGELWPWSKYLAVRSHIFLGRDLIPSKLPGDETEQVETVRVAWHEINTMVADGRLRDARAIAALYRVRLALDTANSG